MSHGVFGRGPARPRRIEVLRSRERRKAAGNVARHSAVIVYGALKCFMLATKSKKHCPDRPDAHALFLSAARLFIVHFDSDNFFA